MKPWSKKRAKKATIDLIFLLGLILILALAARLVGEDSSMLPWEWGKEAKPSP
jgi:hypothetical protein